jgi:hypothetical protein
MSKKENLKRESAKPKRHLMNVVRLPSKKPSRVQEAKTIVSSAATGELVSGFPTIPDIDLINKGGKTISDLSFVNFYVGKSGSWNENDIKSIDSALAAAMSDKNLNNVMVQYFPGHNSITSTFRGSQLLSGKYPKRFFKDDVEKLVSDLFSQKKLDSYDLNNTVFNFMLPSGTMLNDGERIAGEESKTISTQRKPESDGKQETIEEEESDSLTGLGGFHGSIHVPRNIPITIYYAVGVYSELLPDGRRNGIPVFDMTWKNVVATFYHELNEVRTDPDVGDIKLINDPRLGWYSDGINIPSNSRNYVGGEIGDIPIDEANVFAGRDLSTVFKEVPLTDGTGTVPIQLQYSNAVHGPEGPIPAPHSK